jgi:hypothetical protein
VYHWLFRRSKLCPGSASCAEALQQSGGEYQCEECAGLKLDLFQATMRGRRIALVNDIDRAKQAGLTYGPHDLNYVEMLLLRILNEEREAYTDEMMKEAQKKKA